MRSGQALVIVLFILAVTAAVGLSVISRSVTEVNLSSNQDASSQSLSAAESGIEAVLQQPDIALNAPVTVNNNSKYTVTARTAIGGGTTLQIADNLFSGESATLFLRQVDATGKIVPSGTAYGDPTFTVCWGRAGVSPGPALEVSVYNQVSGNYNVTHRGFNGTRSVPGFTNPLFSGSTGCNPGTYLYRDTVSVPAGSILAKFRLLFNESVGHPIRVIGAGGNFPEQGQVNEVQGQTGQTSRRVSVTQTFPAPPGILDNALFSGVDL